MNADIIGYSGTGLLTVTMLPQVYKTFRHKRADDISGVYLFLQIISNGLFIMYGFCIDSMPIIISNVVVSFCSISIVCAKIMYGNKSDSATPLLTIDVP